jgi:hypothetical protein
VDVAVIGGNGTARETAKLAATTRAARRVVLLAGDEQSEVVEVLREYSGVEVSGKRLHQDVRELAAKFPGRQVAAEWLGPLGWTRFLWCRR